MDNLYFPWEVVVYLLGLAAMWGSLQQRIRTLEKKMELHNSAVERLTKAEMALAVHDEKIKVVNKRIDEVKEGAE